MPRCGGIVNTRAACRRAGAERIRRWRVHAKPTEQQQLLLLLPLPFQPGAPKTARLEGRQNYCRQSRFLFSSSCDGFRHPFGYYSGAHRRSKETSRLHAESSRTFEQPRTSLSFRQFSESDRLHRSSINSRYNQPDTPHNRICGTGEADTTEHVEFKARPGSHLAFQPKVFRNVFDITSGAGRQVYRIVNMGLLLEKLN